MCTKSWNFVFFNAASKSKQNEPTKAKKLKLDMSMDDEDEEMVRSTSKRKFSRIIDTDSDSDRENESNNGNKAADDDDVGDGVAKVAPKRLKVGHQPAAKKKIELEPVDDSKAAKDFQRALKANLDKAEELSDVREIVDVPMVYRHQTLEFLKPDKIRDGEKRKPSDPKYDPTTLFVPKDYLDSLTPVIMRVIFRVNSSSNKFILTHKK